jgi:hypothetical protein
MDRSELSYSEHAYTLTLVVLIAIVGSTVALAGRTEEAAQFAQEVRENFREGLRPRDYTGRPCTSPGQTVVIEGRRYQCR